LVPNLFLAARPAPDDVVAIAGLARRLNQDHGLHGHPIKPENLHVTLVEFMGVKEREQTVLEKVPAAAKRVALPAFDVVFDRAASFVVRKENAVVLTGGEGCAGLVTLQRALIAALHKEWLKIPPNPRYTPHMTLLYAGTGMPEIAVPPLRWTATEFVFIRSLTGKSTHLVLDRWPLRG
jgi:2'-5' RNA ligase